MNEVNFMAANLKESIRDVLLQIFKITLVLTRKFQLRSKIISIIYMSLQDEFTQ